jgi:5S rRNA maturation endonuclease (ribonuclease M5)
MIIHIDRIKTIQGVVKGLNYQTEDKENPNLSRGEIFRGNPLEVIAWSKSSNSEKVKAFSVLVSFEESKEELKEKLKSVGKTIDDLISEIEKFLFAGYKPEEVAYTIIAHDDTDNFHFHIYVANNFASTGKTLKFWFTPQDLKTFRKYIDLKYGLTSPDLDRKETLVRKIGSKNWKSEKHLEREVLREEIHELVLTGINAGLVKDRQSLVEFLESQGLKVNRKGKNYISVEVEGIKIRLKGGIYDENFRVSELIKETERGNREDLYGELEKLRESLREYYRRKNREIEERYGNIRKQFKADYPEGIKDLAIGEQKTTKRKRMFENAFNWTGFRSGNNNPIGNFLSDTSLIVGKVKKKLKTCKTEIERLKREIELPQLLSYLNIPFYRSGNYILTKVPWREDRNPSFIAHKKGDRWLWYDASKEEGGSVIDFVIKTFGYSFSQALDWLKENEERIKQEEVKPEYWKEFQRVEIVNLRMPSQEEEKEWLTEVWNLKYLPPAVWIADLKFKERRVRDTQKGFPEIVEVEKEYLNPVLVLAIGDEILFWRDIDPYRTQKGWVSSNQPVLIEGRNRNLYVVEGLSDYITLYQLDPEGSFLILGSVANVDKVIQYLQQQEEKGKNIFLVLDNDESGISATRKIKTYLKSAINLSEKFEAKDFKEFWLSSLPDQKAYLKGFIEEKSKEERKLIEKRRSKGFGLGL